MTRLRMKIKNKSKKPLKGKGRQRKSPRNEMQVLRKLQSTLKKTAETKIPKPEKKCHRNLVIKQKVMKKRRIVIRGTKKKATRFSSRLKLMPEKLKNYYTEQN